MGQVIFSLVFLMTVSNVLIAGWTRHYGGFRDDQAYSVKETADGGYIVAGNTKSFGVGAPDFANVYLLKTNGLGDTIWTRTYGGDGDEFSYSVELTGDGGYILSGTTNSFGEGGYDIYIVKTSASGNPLWTLTYGGADDDFGCSIQETIDGGYIVAGYTKSFGTGENDIYLLKLSPTGEVLWANTYGGAGDDFAYAVQQTSDEGYIIAGYTNSYGAGRDNIYLVKTDYSGEIIWTRVYGEDGHEQAFSVQQTNDGGYIVAGFKETPDGIQRDIYLVKTDADGNILWDETYGGDNDDFGRSAQQTSDGGYIITGWTDSYGAGSYDVYLIKTDAEGEILWTNTYGGSRYDYGFSVCQTADNRYIVAGWTLSFGFGGWNIYLIKVNQDGSLTPQYQYNISSGWNLLSYPLTGTVTIGDLFPSADLPFYTYDNPSASYSEITTISPGLGFWLFSLTDDTVTVLGDDQGAITGTLLQGWNLIAGPGIPVATSLLTDLPDVIPPIYRYIDNHYVAVNDVLLPGVGYWVLASDEVEYSLPPTGD